MKRWISLLLSLIMAVGLAVPALAEAPPAGDSMDQALTDITLRVKQTLGVDDGYTDFYGDYNDNVTPRWSLNWSDDNRQLSVEADPDGKVLYVNRWTSTDRHDRFYGFDPAFPALSRDEAETQAEAWLARLMGPGETGRVDGVRTVLSEDGYYRFSGTVEINGLESPITFSMEIDGDGLAYYSRSDNYSAYVGDIPSAEPAVDQAKAEKSLTGAVALELYYVSDGEGGARLRYVPVGPYTVVDASDGDAVDMDALYASFESNASRNGAGAITMDAEAAADAGGAIPAASLTQVELSSIASYSDVLDQTAIDGLLRDVETLGLADFQVQRCSYSMDSETGDVTASLRYTGEMTDAALYGYSQDEWEEYQSWGDELTIYKYITVNAKTGALLSVSTNYPLWKTDESVWMKERSRKAAAERFLEKVAPDFYGESELCTLTGYDREGVYTYAQVHEGYLYPENYLRLEINPAAGTVDSFSYTWDEDVTFAASEGIISEADATQAYVDALDVTLGYVAWPVDIEKLDEVLYARYLDWGYIFVETLRLGYYFSGLDVVDGVDALTGEAVDQQTGVDGTYVYDDLAGQPRADMINTLGQAGIGFADGSFEPAAALTQLDAVTLLLQAAGYRTGSWDEETVRSEAVWQGFLKEADWAPESQMTRMGFIHMMLGASRYGDAAELLSGGSGEMGYITIAQALKLDVSGSDDLTRADGAELLYVFMNR